MKKLIRKIVFILALIWLQHFSINAQYPDGFIYKNENLSIRNEEYISESYYPTCNYFIKYIRVSFHFILRSDGTGNFTKTDDGYGNTNYTGYDYALDVIHKANERLRNTDLMNLPENFNDKPEIIPSRIRLILNSVEFHKDDYKYNNYKFNGLAVPNTINFYFFQLTPEGKMHANSSGILNGYWHDYLWHQYAVPFPVPGILHSYITEGTIIHEIGHILGLSHTMRHNTESYCINYNYDGLFDTPTVDEILQNTGQNPCDGCYSVTFGSGCTNNFMDASRANAITPQQLAVMHYWLENFESDKYMTYYIETDDEIIQLEGDISGDKEAMIITAARTSSTTVKSKTSCELRGRFINLSKGFRAEKNSSFRALFKNVNITLTDEGVCIELPDPPGSGGLLKSKIVKDEDLFLENEQININPQINIYPNPNKGIFTVELNNYKNVNNFKIYNSIGKVVYETNTVNSDILSINLSGYSKGLCIIKTETTNGVYLNKVLIE